MPTPLIIPGAVREGRMALPVGVLDHAATRPLSVEEMK